jgi:cobalamin biosynthesis protein CobD/CbiB
MQQINDGSNQNAFLEIFKQNWNHMRQQETIRMWVGNVFIALMVAMSAFLVSRDNLEVPVFVPIVVLVFSIFCLLVTLKTNHVFDETQKSTKNLLNDGKIVSDLKDWRKYVGMLESKGIWKLIKIRYLYVALYTAVVGISVAWLIYLLSIS